MSTSLKYKKYIVDGGRYRKGLIRRPHVRQTRISWIFKPSDCPDKWNMKRVLDNAGYAWSGRDIFWAVGYIHRGQLAYQRNPNRIGITPSFYLPRTQPPPKYWWCRDGDWIPFWGVSTKQRCNLMKELRTFWIKKVMLKTTNLPEDIIGILPNYL